MLKSNRILEVNSILNESSGYELERMFSKFDWFYQMSDDQKYWKEGEEEKQKIQDFIDDMDPKVAGPIVKKYMKKYAGMGASFFVRG